jgi:prepilin signal peptidase PulO-like enzyme (type II secretory pathway)
MIVDVIPALSRDPAFLTAFILFAFGAIIGSFLNVVALRFISQEDIVHKPSHCPQCGHRLTWLELFPIFSYIFLKAHCRHCTQIISPQYPIVEAATGFITLLLFWPGNVVYTFPQAILIFIAIAVLLVLCIIDAKTFILPDLFIIILAVLAILFLVTHISQAIFMSALIGTLVGSGFLWIIWYATGGRGLGLGDVKLMGPICFFLGGPATAVCLFIAFMIGGLFGTFLLVTKHASMKTAIPFGPFLAGSAILLLLLPNLAPYLLSFIGWPL